MNDEDEALRTLRRMENEREKLLAGQSSDHPTDDPIEIWGRRIGRSLSVVLAIGLLIYLWLTYVQP